MRGFSAIAVIGLMALAIWGCSSGTSFDPADVSRLRPGVSTRSDAIALLGPPDGEVSEPDGSQLLSWTYARVFIGTTGRSVSILFNPAGRMVRVLAQSAAGFP